MSVVPIRRRPATGAQGLSRQILSRGDMVEVLHRLPYMALIVNRDRETVFANQMLLDTLGLASLEKSLAERPGELLGCEHSRTHADGCGSAEGCRHCHAAQTLRVALEERRRVVGEARISARSDGRLTAYDLRVTAQPLALGDDQLVMIFLEDISDQKRREHLESTFLHDLLNSVGSLQLLSELMLADHVRARPEELVRQVQLLGDEIRAQQLLGEAERSELVRDVLCVPVRQLLEEALGGIGAWSDRRTVAFDLELPAEPLYLATDPLMARRVLVNAVKNAVEASDPGQNVVIRAAAAEPFVTVSVWNHQAMAESTQAQVFQRSFSTKGEGRGLGTYSMRLLMENYLGGTVGFVSSPAAGTTFTLSFPSTRSQLTASR